MPCVCTQGELYIIGGEGSSDGFRDLFKVPLPLDEAPIPTFRYDFLQLYDEDTMIGTDGPGKPSNATGLTGKIQMCYPTNSPVYPCIMKLTGKAWWWRTMLACDGQQGCEQASESAVNRCEFIVNLQAVNSLYEFAEK